MQSKRISNISVSPTVSLAAKAIEMKARGFDLIELNIGEPDLPTPENIKQAAYRAIEKNFTKYTNNSGLIELRQAIAGRIEADHGVRYNADEIIISNGAKQALYNVILTLVNSGDQVIIPGPYYPSYTEMVRLAGGDPVYLMAKESRQFKLSPGELEKKINHKTRIIIICNPCNPTGAVYSQEELVDFVQVIQDKEIYIISDEIYSGLVYDKIEFTTISGAGPEIKSRSIVVSGVSKSYAMTGWRIGFAAGAKEIIEGANKIQSHSTSNACTISQHAAIEALGGSQESVHDMRLIFERRRDLVYTGIINIPGITCIKPRGAFYAFPNISAYLKRNNNSGEFANSEEFCQYLLDKAGVVVVPGSAFGSDDHIRISFSNSMDRLEEGLERISKALSDLFP